MVRLGFGMPWPRTLYGAWLVLRANQAWAPYPDNDPTAATSYMRRFYGLVARDAGMSFDPARAAELEVRWWRVHRAHQHGAEPGSADGLVAALTELYAYTYGARPTPSGPRRSSAPWRCSTPTTGNRAGHDLDDPLLDAERSALVASYTALLAAVRR